MGIHLPQQELGVPPHSGTHSKGGTAPSSLGSPTVGACMFVCKSRAIIQGLNQRYLSMDGEGIALQTLRGKLKSLLTKANVCKPQEQRTGFQKERKNTKEKSFPCGERKISKEKSETFGSYFIYLKF